MASFLSGALGLLEAMQANQAVVIGHDWGSIVAYLLATHAPERVSRLVVIGMPHLAEVRPSLHLLWLTRHLIGLRMPWARRRMRRNHFAQVDALYRRWSPTWAFSDEETAPVKAIFSDDASLDAALGYYRGFKPITLLRHLQPTIPPGFTDAAFEASRPKFTGEFRYVMLPGGHFVHRESPEATRDAILEFLA